LLYREEREGRPVEAQPCRPVHPFPPSPAVTQHLPVAGGVLSRIVKVARGRKTRPKLGERLHLPVAGGVGQHPGLPNACLPAEHCWLVKVTGSPTPPKA